MIKLRGRFFLDRDESAAADAMLAIIADAYNKFTTNAYDYIQAAQQKIYYYRGEKPDQ